MSNEALIFTGVGFYVSGRCWSRQYYTKRRL